VGWGRAFVRVQQTLRARDHKARDLQAAVAPATVGLGLRCNVHRPHAGGSPSARRPASEGGSRYGHTPARAGHAYPTPMGETGGALHGALADALYHRDLLLHRHSREMGLWSCGVASWGCAFWLVGGGVLRAGIALLAGQERVLSWGTFAVIRAPISLMLLQVRGCVRVGWSRASYSLSVLSCARCLVWVVI
jgi:hypothetical protein